MDAESESDCKSVLVFFGESRRVIDVPRSYTASSERDFVLSACRAEFREHLPKDLEFYTLTLQVKDDQWGGMYLDYKAHSVVGQGRLQARCSTSYGELVPKIVCPFQCSVHTPGCHHLAMATAVTMLVPLASLLPEKR